MIHPYYVQVYLACGPTDFRKSIAGLAVIIKESFELDPFAPALFVFCNRNKDKLKILQWNHNGFWLYYKRLETGKYSWPDDPSSKVTNDLASPTSVAIGWVNNSTETSPFRSKGKNDSIKLIYGNTESD